MKHVDGTLSIDYWWPTDPEEAEPRTRIAHVQRNGELDDIIVEIPDVLNGWSLFIAFSLQAANAIPAAHLGLSAEAEELLAQGRRRVRKEP